METRGGWAGEKVHKYYYYYYTDWRPGEGDPPQDPRGAAGGCHQDGQRGHQAEEDHAAAFTHPVLWVSLARALL